MGQSQAQGGEAGAQTPTPALALSDGHHRQSASKARPRRATPKPMGRRERGIGPGRAEAGCGPQPPERSDKEGDQRNHRRPLGPARCSPDRLPPFHRHAAFPYELVQREVRHLVAGPNDKTQRARPGHDIIVLPLLAPPPEVRQSVPPVPPECARGEGVPQPPAAPAHLIYIRSLVCPVPIRPVEAVTRQEGEGDGAERSGQRKTSVSGVGSRSP